MFLFDYCRKYQDELHMVPAVKELLNHPLKEENLVDTMYFMLCTGKGEGSVVQVPHSLPPESFHFKERKLAKHNSPSVPSFIEQNCKIPFQALDKSQSLCLNFHTILKRSNNLPGHLVKTD